jgi:hypothetical protein
VIDSVEVYDRALDAHQVAEHYHRDNKGIIHACYHRCRHWLNPKFLAGFTVSQLIGFPFEHALYEKVYPFTLITHWLGV